MIAPSLPHAALGKIIRDKTTLRKRLSK